jgi:hypothetical protein
MNAVTRAANRHFPRSTFDRDVLAFDEASSFRFDCTHPYAVLGQMPMSALEGNRGACSRCALAPRTGHLRPGQAEHHALLAGDLLHGARNRGDVDPADQVNGAIDDNLVTDDQRLWPDGSFSTTTVSAKVGAGRYGGGQVGGCAAVGEPFGPAPSSQAAPPSV